MGVVDTSALPQTSRRRRIVGVLVVLVVLAALGVAVMHNWRDFVDTWKSVGLGRTALSLLLGAGCALTTWLQWHTVLTGLGVTLPRRSSARVFFLGQLGKYVPGSVWAVVLQMESGRRHGASRRTVLATNLIVIAMSLTTGLLLAGLLLPFSVPEALGRFWWALAMLPLLVVAVHPRTLVSGLDLVLRRIRHEPLGVVLPGPAVAIAMLWSTAAWLLLGAQTTVLCQALGGRGFGLFALCTGGVALAVSAGILVLPAPAGAGPREVVLAYVLGTVLTGSAALALVIASRVIAIAVDLIIAAVAFLAASRRRGRT